MFRVSILCAWFLRFGCSCGIFDSFSCAWLSCAWVHVCVCFLWLSCMWVSASIFVVFVHVVFVCGCVRLCFPDEFFMFVVLSHFSFVSCFSFFSLFLSLSLFLSFDHACECVLFIIFVFFSCHSEAIASSQSTSVTIKSHDALKIPIGFSFRATIGHGKIVWCRM